MKLRNRETGEIGTLLRCEWNDSTNSREIAVEVLNSARWYKSLVELNEEWEDYHEEPKGKWFISNNGQIHNDEDHERYREERKSIGNYFETKEEAEKAVEKLKALKRLKDKGFKFIGKTYETDKRFGSIFYKVDDDTYSEDIIDDLDLLFCMEVKNETKK